MKRYYALLFIWVCLCGYLTSQAQDTLEVAKTDTIITPVADTTEINHDDTINLGPVSIIQYNDALNHRTTKVIFGPKTPRQNHLKDIDVSWLGLDLGWNNFTDRSAYGTAEVNDFALPGPGGKEATADQFSLRAGKSVNVNIWPLLIKVNLVNHFLSVKSGFGIEMNNYRYSRPISYMNEVSKTYIVHDSISFKKNKLFTEYLTIPVLLHLESNPYHSSSSFRMSVGPTFGFLVKSRTKQVSKERGKEKNNDSFNLEKFRTGMRAELGYGPITLYGAYSFTPIHQNGLKQYPYSIGIILLNNKGW